MPGIYEYCMSGHHEECHNKDCRCGCHPWTQAMVQARPITVNGNSSASGLVCPSCSKQPRSGDLYCRADGTRLVAGKTCSCGKSAETMDLYCGGCGKPFTANSPAPAKDPIVQFTEADAEELEREAARLETIARKRPSDVEVPPIEVH